MFVVETKNLTIGAVRKAVEALQIGDKKAWLEQFSPKAFPTDDGNPLSRGHRRPDRKPGDWAGRMISK